MADQEREVGATALDLISQLRKANFSPELAEQAVTTKDYAQIPPGYRPPIERPATAGYDYGSTFWDKLYEKLMSAHEGMVGGWKRGETFRGAGEMALGALGGATAIPEAALEQLGEKVATSERLQRAIGEKPTAFLGGLAETIPWFLMGGPKKVPTKGRLKIPRVAPGKATYTDKTGFGTEMMERRGPSRMSDEEWANLHRRSETYKTPNPEGQADIPPSSAIERMKTLYRGERQPGAKKTDLPPWLAEAAEDAGVTGARGRWFTDDPQIAQWYVREASPGQMSSVRLPESLAQARGASLNPEARRFSAMGDAAKREYFLTPQEAAQRQKIATEVSPSLEASNLPQFRDPISHRQTEMDPGFFGPLIENYYKSLTREGIGPSISGGAPVRPQGWDRTRYNPFQREDLESIRNRGLMGRDMVSNPSVTMGTELTSADPGLAALKPPMHPDVMQGYLQAGGMLPNEARKLSRFSPEARYLAKRKTGLKEAGQDLGRENVVGLMPQEGQALTRPWPGVYKGKISEGRTQPKSYRKPKTYDLSEYE